MKTKTKIIKWKSKNERLRLIKVGHNSNLGRIFLADSTRQQFQTTISKPLSPPSPFPPPLKSKTADHHKRTTTRLFTSAKK